MRHRFIQDLYGRSFEALLLSGRTSTLAHDDVKRTAGRTVTVSEENGR